MKYIVGRPFKSHLGVHSTGDTLPAKEVEGWKNFDSLINSGLLYRLGTSGTPLPTYLLSFVDTPARIKQLVSHKPESVRHEKPDVVKAAEERIEAEQLATQQYKDKRTAIANKLVNQLKPRKPVEDSIPETQLLNDSNKAKSAKESTDFDPEKIRTMNLDDLRAEAKERGLTTSGPKAEVAQRIIDDEIGKAHPATKKADDKAAKEK